MPKTDPAAVDPISTYIHFPDGGGAKAIEVTDAFWPELMSGQRQYPGRLLTGSEVSTDAGHWEMHPNGEEVLVMLSGAVDIILDDGSAEQIVPLEAGRACIVPRGVWHRFVVREPGRMVFITAGEGTQHRPLD